MALDWTAIYKKYKGLWIVLLDDEKTVVGSGQTLKEAIHRAEKRGHKNPIVTRVPEELTAYVGYGL